MKVLITVICLFSSLVMAKSLPINEPVSSNIEMNLVSPSGECMNVWGQQAIDDLLAQDWIVDEANLCVGAVLESGNGDCVETNSSSETALLIKNGHRLLDLKSCN